MTLKLELAWWALTALQQENLLLALMQLAKERSYAYAFYSLPVLFYSEQLPRRRSMPIFFFSRKDLQTATVGEWRRYGGEQPVFVFSPFLLKKRTGKEFYDFPFQYLLPTLIWDCQNKTMRLFEQTADVQAFAAAIEEIVENLLKSSAQSISAPVTTLRSASTLPNSPAHEIKLPFYQGKENKPTNIPLEHFITGVERILQEIRHNNIKKAVLSRTQYFKWHTWNAAQASQAPAHVRHVGKAIVQAFRVVLTSLAYNEAMVCLFSAPSAGTWFTVSPEILVSQTQDLFRTVALAGTQAYQLDQAASQQNMPANLHKVLWSDKEIQEQVMVSRYIIDCFKTLRLRAYTEKGPKTVRRGNLLHLETKFMVDTQRVYSQELVLDMLSLLHPTSAVAGDPLVQALCLLATLEGYDRRYYSGFLGPLQLKDSTVIYVNLRCAQLLASGIIAYAGAGIVKQSSPQLEWQETVHKLNAIKSFFTLAIEPT